MPIAQRTASSGVFASGATAAITLPTGGVAVGDMLVLVIGNANTTGPNAPTGWTRHYSASGGTSQCCSVYSARYAAALTLTFTNVASIAAWACNAYFQAGTSLDIDGTVTAATNTSNNATMSTGAPTTGTFAGDFEVLAYAWTLNATISGVAAGSAIDATRANGTTISVAIGRNTNTNLAASTAATAFSQTLSATNRAKTGVGLLLLAERLPNVQSNGVTSTTATLRRLRGVAVISGAGGGTVTTATLGKIVLVVYRDLAAAADGSTVLSATVTRRRGLAAVSAAGSSGASATISSMPSVTNNVTWAGSSFGLAGVNPDVHWSGGAFQPITGPRVLWDDPNTKFTLEAA